MPITTGPASLITTFNDLISRIFRDWLIPVDAQPIRFPLTSDIDADPTTTTLPYSPATLPPEIEAALSPGVILELDLEQVSIVSLSPSTNTITVRRGVNGTSLSSHPTDTPITLAPPYSRLTIFNALQDAVTSLYPTLYRVRTHQFTTADTPIEIPSDYISPQSLLVMSGNYPTPASFTELIPFPLVASSKAILLEHTPSSLPGFLTYRSSFAAPSSPDDLLFDYGIDPAWIRLLCVDVVSQVIHGRDLDAQVVENIVAHMEADSFPPLTATRLHQSLLRYHEYLLNRAVNNLKAQHGLPQTYNGRFSSM